MLCYKTRASITDNLFIQTKSATITVSGLDTNIFSIIGVLRILRLRFSSATNKNEDGKSDDNERTVEINLGDDIVLFLLLFLEDLSLCLLLRLRLFLNGNDLKLSLDDDVQLHRLQFRGESVALDRHHTLE